MKAKILTLLALLGSFVAACLAIWQLGWLREVCAPILNAAGNHDLVIQEAQIFGMKKELSLSFIFTGSLLEVAAFFALVAFVIAALAWKRKSKSDDSNTA